LGVIGSVPFHHSYKICGPVVDHVVLTTHVLGFVRFSRLVRKRFEFVFHDGHALGRNQLRRRKGSLTPRSVHVVQTLTRSCSSLVSSRHGTVSQISPRSQGWCRPSFLRRVTVMIVIFGLDSIAHGFAFRFHRQYSEKIVFVRCGCSVYSFFEGEERPFVLFWYVFCVGMGFCNCWKSAVFFDVER